MKIVFQIAVTFFVLFCEVKTSKAQVPDSIRFLQEISRIQAAYSDTSGLVFKSTYYYESFDGDYSEFDTMTAAYQFKGEMMSFSMDSVHIVQNDQYQVVVYHLDSMMQVNTPVDMHKTMLQANFYDSLFYQMNIGGVTITDFGAVRKLKFTFLGNSPYSKYEISYDTANYRLSSVEYMVKQTMSPSTGSAYTGPYISIKINYSNYSTTQLADNIFSTDQFFVRQNGVLTAVSPYTGFSIINQSVEE